MESKRNALVRHVAEMPAAAIYALADKGHLFRGFELLKRCPVSGVVWSEDGATLRMELHAEEVIQVAFTLQLGELSPSCECGVWSPSGYCPHVVASLATLKKAVSPASFPMLHLPQPYLDLIRSHLPIVSESRAPGEEEFSLLVEPVGDDLRLQVRRGSDPAALFDPTLPMTMREFLRSMVLPAFQQKVIEEFRARFRRRYPVVFAGPDGEIPLTLDTDRTRSTRLLLDSTAGRLTGTRTLEDGTPLGETSIASEQYHFDTKAGRIERIEDPAGLRFYRRLTAVLAALPDSDFREDRQGFSVSLTGFNKMQLSLSTAELDQFLRHTQLTRQGEPAPLRQLQPDYRLNLTESANRFVLVAEGQVEGMTFPLSHEAFWFFPAAGRARFPQPLRAKKRVITLLDACFASLTCRTRTDRDRVIRNALSGADFSKRGVKSEARRLIAGFWQAVTERQTLLQLGDAGWLAVEFDAGLQARLLEIPYRLFGAELFAEASAPGEMSVDRASLLQSLPALRTACERAGFTLTMDGRPLEAVSWSFTLDATRSTIDWFELRPEIRFQGELVDEQEFLDAVRGGGLFRKNGSIVILDEESSRNLSFLAAHGKKEVVRVPRLQILDWIVLRRNGVRILLSPEDEQIIDSLVNFERIPQLAPPSGLQATLRKYQVEGYSWLGFLYEHRFGACLADDMGLGKTIQAIALLAGLLEGGIKAAEVAGPHLVVVPPSLIFNWESEIARFYPRLNVMVYRGTGRRADFEGVDVVLTSYGVVQRDIEELGQIPFHVIVFDEAQSIKNIHAETTGAVRRLKGRFKLALTGTPVENHLGEYYSVMDLALPGLLGPYEPFRKQMGRDDPQFLDTLIRRTRPFILRRSKDMIASELPPKVETDIYLEMSPRQKALYVRTVAQVKETVAQAYSSNSAGQARIIALTAILKLRQICLSTNLLIPDMRDASPKIEFLIEQVRELFEEGHSVLVFSQFTSFLDVVQEAFEAEQIRHFRLDGSTPVGKRKELVQGFQECTDPSVFLLSLKAGGRGLNLTRASYVFHLDPWWNPAVESQASDRAHRLGQLRQVTITRLLMRHSIEEKMMELKKRKLRLYQALLEDAELESSFTIGREDFEFLLGQ
ncbi:DEAD/DEAH box helicase [Geomesophilobacter sediminis]|uniref:DEAD/DEAH box helicase n=1 Tax=Geomesophilobacter sediminis TaxID=2798584 RepID=A0A8J7M062_9BACT|nr:DEAD/DEAH box helicase [Geomesophilobacter sediminis]MBJ6723522.1 DEAD/DEAH box helicase [Geomesophilobacter sediminis]